MINKTVDIAAMKEKTEHIENVLKQRDSDHSIFPDRELTSSFRSMHLPPTRKMIVERTPESMEKFWEEAIGLSKREDTIQSVDVFEEAEMPSLEQSREDFVFEEQDDFDKEDTSIFFDDDLFIEDEIEDEIEDVVEDDFKTEEDIISEPEMKTPEKKIYTDQTVPRCNRPVVHLEPIQVNWLKWSVSEGIYDPEVEAIKEAELKKADEEAARAQAEMEEIRRQKEAEAQLREAILSKENASPYLSVVADLPVEKPAEIAFEDTDITEDNVLFEEQEILESESVQDEMDETDHIEVEEEPKQIVLAEPDDLDEPVVGTVVVEKEIVIETGIEPFYQDQILFEETDQFIDEAGNEFFSDDASLEEEVENQDEDVPVYEDTVSIQINDEISFNESFDVDCEETRYSDQVSSSYEVDNENLNDFIEEDILMKVESEKEIKEEFNEISPNELFEEIIEIPISDQIDSSDQIDFSDIEPFDDSTLGYDHSLDQTQDSEDISLNFDLIPLESDLLIEDEIPEDAVLTEEEIIQEDNPFTEDTDVEDDIFEETVLIEEEIIQKENTVSEDIESEDDIFEEAVLIEEEIIQEQGTFTENIDIEVQDDEITEIVDDPFNEEEDTITEDTSFIEEVASEEVVQTEEPFFEEGLSLIENDSENQIIELEEMLTESISITFEDVSFEEESLILEKNDSVDTIVSAPLEETDKVLVDCVENDPSAFDNDTDMVYAPKSDEVLVAFSEPVFLTEDVPRGTFDQIVGFDISPPAVAELDDASVKAEDIALEIRQDLTMPDHTILIETEKEVIAESDSIPPKDDESSSFFDFDDLSEKDLRQMAVMDAFFEMSQQEEEIPSVFTRVGSLSTSSSVDLSVVDEFVKEDDTQVQAVSDDFFESDEVIQDDDLFENEVLIEDEIIQLDKMEHEDFDQFKAGEVIEEDLFELDEIIEESDDELLLESEKSLSETNEVSTDDANGLLQDKKTNQDSIKKPLWNPPMKMKK